MLQNKNAITSFVVSYEMRCSDSITDKTVKDSSPIKYEIPNWQARARRRFKAAIRTVLGNITWMKEGIPNNLTSQVRKTLYDINIRLAAKFKMISLEDKFILFQPLSWRDSSSRKRLFNLLEGLKFFRIYPKVTRQKLSTVARFVCYGANRTILKPGLMASAMYFILTGKIQKTEKESDKYSIVTVLSDGAIIGLEELFYDESHNATYISLTPVELIYVEKDHFEVMMANSLKKQFSAVRHAMSLFKYFSNYSEKTIRDACLSAKILKFHKDETIYGEGLGHNKSVYFITSGKCQIIETLLIKTERVGDKIIYSYHQHSPLEKSTVSSVDDSGHFLAFDRFENISDLKIPTSLHFPPSSTTSSFSYDSMSHHTLLSTRLPKTHCYDVLPKDVKVVFMETGLMSEGACFNLGESFVNKRIIALDRVECLCLPRSWLLPLNTPGFWESLKRYIEKIVPSNEQLFKIYVKNQSWREHKQHLVRKILTKRKSKDYANLHDVAISVRIKNEF